MMKLAPERLLCSLVGTLLMSACAAQGAAEGAKGSGGAPDLAGLTLEEKLELVVELRADLDHSLLTPDAGLLSEHADLVEAEGVRVNRVLNRGQFEGLTAGRGGGAYFSFTSLTNDYNQGPDLELQQWRFMSGFAGRNFGHVVRLEADSLLEVELGDAPVELQADEAPPRSRPRLEQVGPGEVYVVRSIRVGESDILVALQILARDDYGVTFAWKTLAKFAIPQYD